MLKTLLKSLGHALDGLGVALCAFDDIDRAMCWNQTFLQFFPEHRGHVHEGEPYQENLRRFYRTRLKPDELPHIDTYIAEGVERHRSQQRPFEFAHRGFRYTVSSVDMGPFGRVRVWRRTSVRRQATSAAATRHADSADREVLERVADGVLLVDQEDRAVWANTAFLELYGRQTMEDVSGKSFGEIYQAVWSRNGTVSDNASEYATLRERQRFSGAPFLLRLPGDRWVRVLEQRDATGLVPGVFIHTDITAQTRQTRALREAEKSARESEARYQLLAEYSSDITVALHHETVVYISPSVRRILGWAPSDIEGKSLIEFCHPDDAAGIQRAMERLTGQPEADYRGRAKRPDGSYVWTEARARKASDDREPNAPTLVINVRSIAARKLVEDQLLAAQKKLEELAVTDALTGIANRRRLDETLALECRRSARELSPLSAILMDIDDFKQINDQHGHAVGDEVLRRLGALLAREVRRGGELAARLGGEEFVVVLAHSDEEQAERFAESLRARIAELDLSDLQISGVTVSVGVATSPGPDKVPCEPSHLLRLADGALYAAKRSGKNRVCKATLER